MAMPTMETAQPLHIGRAGAARSSTNPLGWRNWANIVAYGVNLAVTYGSLAGIFGETNTVLSKKYQTLVTPAGWAFSIWGPIFVWEAIFAAMQLLPRFRDSLVVRSVSACWWAVCCFQALWSILFAAELITLAFLCMLGILGSLLSLIWRASRVTGSSTAEYWLLRAPFSLHTGWVIAASAVNASVQADALKASPATLLCLGIVSFAAVAVAVVAFTTTCPKPDPVICLVAVWAFAGISSELNNAENLADPTRFNPHKWDATTLAGMSKAAYCLAIAMFLLAVLSALLRTLAWSRKQDRYPQALETPSEPATSA